MELEDYRGGPVMMMTLSFTLLYFGQRTNLKLRDGMDVLLGGVRGYMTNFRDVLEGTGVCRWDGKLLAECFKPSLGRRGHDS